MLPLLNRYSEHYRGPANSREYNQLRENVHFDITKLYDYTAHNHVRIHRNMDIIITENYFLQNRLIELEQLLNDMEQSIDSEGDYRHLSATYGTYKQVSYDIDSLNIHIPTDERMKVDTLNRVATIPPSFTESRTTITDLAGRHGIPAGLEMFIYEGTSMNDLAAQMNIPNAVENPTRHYAFDRQRFTFFTHQSDRNQDVTELYVAVHIRLPAINIINAIEIHPFPEFSLSILDVQYRSHGEGWTTLPTYPVVDEVAQPIDNASKMKLIFPAVFAGELIIYMKQPHYFTEDNQHIFMYGFQSIDIQHSEYDLRGASFISKYDLEPYGTLKFQQIGAPVVHTSVGSVTNIEALLSHQLYYEDSGGDIWPGSFGSTLPIADCQRVYVMTTMLPRDNITPMIQSIQIIFDTI